MLILLLVLEAIQVAILWLHDWVPLPPLNDVRAVQAQDSRARLVIVTIVQSLPFTLGFACTLIWLHRAWPAWVWNWLWISNVVLLLGQLRAWWLPYLLRPEPQRAARYRAMFAGTHAFLPERNGITPNTLHCALHAATLGILITLAQLAAGIR